MSTSTRSTRGTRKTREKAPGLWDLKVVVVVLKFGDHDDVTILPALCHDSGNLSKPWPASMADTLTAWRWMHGIACRAVFMRSGEFSQTRERHACKEDDWCELVGGWAHSSEDVTQTHPLADVTPWPTVSVPKAEAKRCAAMLRADVAALVADALAPPPTLDQEREWAGLDVPGQREAST